MKKTFSAILIASTISLGACATTDANDGYAGNTDTLEGAGTGAAIGAVAGAGAGAVIGGLSPIQGALVGAAVGGIAGAIWADRDNDGQADGYYQNGTYYEGTPPPAPVYQQSAPVSRAGERGR
jgi:phage tail tape-measure protein